MMSSVKMAALHLNLNYKKEEEENLLLCCTTVEL